MYPSDEAVHHLPSTRMKPKRRGIREIWRTLLSIQSITDGKLRNISQLPPQLDLVDGLVVEELLPEIHESVPSHSSMVVPVGQGAEFGRRFSIASTSSCIVLQPTEDLTTQL
jgi:hypothetical protein